MKTSNNRRVSIVIWGIFPNGSKVDVTRSTLIAYGSDRPAVAVVSNEGCISGANSGKAKITVKYADRTFVLSVVIRKVLPLSRQADRRCFHGADMDENIFAAIASCYSAGTLKAPQFLRPCGCVMQDAPVTDW